VDDSGGIDALPVDGASVGPDEPFVFTTGDNLTAIHEHPPEIQVGTHIDHLTTRSQVPLSLTRSHVRADRIADDLLELRVEVVVDTGIMERQVHQLVPEGLP